MVHSDFIPVHRSTSADASPSHQLNLLPIFVGIMWVVIQKTSIDICQPMQNDSLPKSECTIRRWHNQTQPLPLSLHQMTGAKISKKKKKKYKPKFKFLVMPLLLSDLRSKTRKIISSIIKRGIHIDKTRSTS